MRLTSSNCMSIRSMINHIMKDQLMATAPERSSAPPRRAMQTSVILRSGVPIRRTPAALARRFAQICLAVVAESLAGEDVTPLQYAALAYLNDEPDIDHNRLPARLGVEQSHGSLLVDQLVVAGVVQRPAHCHDRPPRRPPLTATHA